jgi:hypothetical protein
MGFNELHGNLLGVPKGGLAAGLENARSPARCQPGPRGGHTERSARLELHGMERHENIFEPAGADNTLRASFWLKFLHWNNSRLEKSYCIQDV